MTRVGIIDCGTNTFNLLVAEVDENGAWKAVFSNKIAVKLAPSPTTGLIGKNRFARGIDALYVHLNNLVNLNVPVYVAYATSGIREAGNGLEFTDTVKKLLGLEIQVISADREAELIFKGIKQFVPLGEEPSITMDIGGGSVEFIIGNCDGIFWKQSLMIGVSRLKGMLRPSNPMTAEEQIATEKFLSEQLAEAIEMCHKHEVKTLIGASGSFDSISQMLGLRGDIGDEVERSIPLGKFDSLHQRLLRSTLDERLAMQGLVPMRADMIVMATMLIKALIKGAELSSIQHSEYALKEGALLEMIEQHLAVWNEN
jgi:exopolyphosphatase / guanosine-5'-triphosphate,3'-diphosphate pyrophosphatase